MERESGQRYRQMAEELRTIAAASRYPVTQEKLVKIAEDYERMAASVERIALSRAVLRPKGKE